MLIACASGKNSCTAGGERPQKLEWKMSADMQTLCGKRILIDEVSERAAPFRVDRLPENLNNQEKTQETVLSAKANLLSYVTECMNLSQKCKPRYGSCKSIERACRHALVGSMMPDGSTTPSTGVLVRASDEAVDKLFEDFERAMAAWKTIEELMPKFTMEGDTSFTPEEQARLLETMNQAQRDSVLPPHNLIYALAEACKGRRFFITKNHSYLGVAPDITWPGDKICVIPGCCAPFIIRPKGDNYESLGECYVAGLMDGEAMEQDEFPLQLLVFE